MRKLTALFVASTLALGAANLAHAADTTTAAPADAKPMMHHKGKFGPHQDMMFKDLNLTDAQKQQIREIMKGQRDQMKRPPLEERRAMHDIIASDTFACPLPCSNAVDRIGGFLFSSRLRLAECLADR